MVRCPNCRGIIDLDDDFCAACGAILNPSAPDTSTVSNSYSYDDPSFNDDVPPQSNRAHQNPDYGDEYGRRSRPPEGRQRRRRGNPNQDRYDDYPPGGHGARPRNPHGRGYQGAAYGAGYWVPSSSHQMDRGRPPRSQYPSDYDEPRIVSVSRPPNPNENGYYDDRPPRKPDKGKEGGSKGKTIVASIIALLLIFLLFGVMFLPQFSGVRENFKNATDDIPKTPFFRTYPEGAEFNYSRTIEVSAFGDFTYTIKVTSPLDIAAGSNPIQEVKSVQPSKAPSTGDPSIRTVPNNMMVWTDTIQGGSDSLTVNFRVKTYLTLWELEGEDSGTVADINQTWKDIYNHDEWPIDENSNGVFDTEDDIDNDGMLDYRIEPTNPAIADLSSQLTSGKNNVYDKAKSIYEYLISDDIMEYETLRGGGLPKACTQTLSEKKGDCDDYSILFSALARAADIPARLKLGVLFDPDKEEWIGHGWAEVYIPLKSGGAILGTVDIVNKQFLLRDPYRVADWTDTGGDINDNGELVSNLDYYYYSFSYIGKGEKKPELFNTYSYKPWGSEKIPMSDAEVTGKPSDESDDSGWGGLDFLPGFESVLTIAAISATTVLFYVSRKQVK